jgi:MraZ protein
VFRGTYEHAIDGKGRTSFPSKFREVLSGQGDSRLILTTGLDGCVVAYPLRAWSAFEEKLMGLPQFDDYVRDLRRAYFQSAAEIEVDGVGRLLIPSLLREHADLRRDAVWAGNGPFIELWDKERHRVMRSKIMDDEERRRAIARRAAELGL